MEEKSLVSLKPDEIGRIKEIAGCNSVKKRLFELGLRRGTQIKVVKNDFGPLIINISGSKLALGRGIASKIIIQM
jgi:Fe2+ transport system protein FeoA